MRWIAFFLSLMGLFPTSLVQASSAINSANRPAAVRVRIQNVASSVSLSGLNIRFVGLENKFRPVAISQNRRVDISRVTVAEKTYWQISQNTVSENLLSSQEALMIQGEDLHQGGTELPNKVLLRESAKGGIDVIGVVPLEEYVMAVLTNEMPLGWPMETLKAQAIAIRSYTKAVMSERAERDFHVESSVLDQVYKKAAGINPTLLQKARTAVQETEGVTLVNLKNRTLKAFYHADCGGKTVPASSVWKQEKDSDVGVAVDKFCETSPRSRWSLTVSKEKLQSVLRNFEGDVHSNEFRKLMGFMDFKSTKFEMIDKEGQIEFAGKGFGHGVGMCQWGSKYLGQQGFSYQRILKHYYPLASFNTVQN
jgi:stage II sporulation protein D